LHRMQYNTSPQSPEQPTTSESLSLLKFTISRLGRLTCLAELVGQIVQIFITFLDALERILRKIVLHKIVPDAGLLRVREHMLPANHPPPDFLHLLFFLVRMSRRPLGAFWQLLHVLYVPQWNPSGILVEVCDRIFPRHADPAEVHLHLHVLGF